MKSVQEKKVYSQSYDDVFRFCHLALTKLECKTIEQRENYFYARIGFMLTFLGYHITLCFTKRSDGQIEVGISSKAGFLLLFSHPKRIVEKIFKEIDQTLDYEKWQKRIYSSA